MLDFLDITQVLLQLLYSGIAAVAVTTTVSANSAAQVRRRTTSLARVWRSCDGRDYSDAVYPNRVRPTAGNDVACAAAAFEYEQPACST